MRKALAVWNRFWFASQSTSTLAVVRMAFAVLLLGWMAALAPSLLSFFGSGGILPRQPDYAALSQNGVWSLLGAAPSSLTVVALYVAMALAALCLLVGFHTRLAAVVVFCALVSFTRRNPYVFNSGDLLLRLEALYLMLAPAGAALSVDRRRRARREGTDFWDSPARAVWPVRLMQVQMSVLYLATVWAKSGGATWHDGTAIAYALRVQFLLRFPVPHLVTRSLLVANVVTFATLAVELALGILVWNRKLRPWVLLAGVALHLAIDYSLRVGFFSYGIFVLYLAFVPPETMDAFVGRVRRRLGRRRQRVEVEDAGPVPAVVQVGTVPQG